MALFRVAGPGGREAFPAGPVPVPAAALARSAARLLQQVPGAVPGPFQRGNPSEPG